MQTCALPNLAGIAGCEIIFGSLCDTKTNCSLRVLGLAFADEVCLVVSNNGKTKVDFTVQVFQYTDCESPRLPVMVLGTSIRHHDASVCRGSSM